MADRKKNLSDTMELDEILKEHRQNREANKQQFDTKVFDRAVQGEQPSLQGNSAKKAQSAQPSQKAKNADLDDDFLVYDNGRAFIDNSQTDIYDNPRKKGKKKKVIIAVCASVVALIAIAGVCFFAFGGMSLFGGNFKYDDNIYVNGVSIGGKTADEARQLLKAEETKMESSVKIDVKAGEKIVTLNKDDFEYTFNTNEVLEAAQTYCENNKFSKEKKEFAIALQLDANSCASAAQKVAKEADVEPKDAKVTAFDSSKKKMFTISDSTKGIQIKQTELVVQLQDFVKGGEVQGELEASLENTEPKYTKEYLEKNIKKLSSFTTTSTNNSSGNSNMELSLSKCNNSIIEPNETWSFNKHTGNSNLTSNGYKEAGVIINGKHEVGVGGGICQSSTTIYNAAMLCGMEPVERTCHYYKSSYVDAGRDATVDYGNLDLKIKNIFEYQLFMECYMDGNVLHCNMYGLENPEFDEIKISSSVTSSFSNGFNAVASRTYYLDGKKVKTESLPDSRYYTSAPGGSSNSSSSSKPASSKKPSSSSTASKATGNQA